MRKFFLFILLLVAGLCSAQFSDEQLYKAYLSSNLTLWGKYIHAQNWSKLSHAERKRLINYEYGYIPAMVDEGKTDEAAACLKQFQQQLQEEKNALTPCEYLTYLSASHAFVYLLDKSQIFSDGMQSFKLAKQAIEADPNNPIAMTLKGNVDFYAPKLFGGSKKKAMQMFIRSEQLMMEDLDTYGYMWNFPAIQLCIAQCHEKMGDLDEAIKQAEKTLRMHPGFMYLRDTYLPELRQKKGKKWFFCQKICSIQKKAVILQPLFEEQGNWGP